MSTDTSIPILLVDDYATMIRIVRNLLKQTGYDNVDEACDGETALAKMAQKKYRLVISDWNMQPMSGYEFLKHVRANSAFDQIAFLMITAESGREHMDSAKQAGADGYLVKPFSNEALRAKIEETLTARI